MDHSVMLEQILREAFHPAENLDYALRLARAAADANQPTPYGEILFAERKTGQICVFSLDVVGAGLMTKVPGHGVQVINFVRDIAQAEVMSYLSGLLGYLIGSSQTLPKTKEALEKSAKDLRMLMNRMS